MHTVCVLAAFCGDKGWWLGVSKCSFEMKYSFSPRLALVQALSFSLQHEETRSSLKHIFSWATCESCPVFVTS